MGVPPSAPRPLFRGPKGPRLLTCEEHVSRFEFEHWQAFQRLALHFNGRWLLPPCGFLACGVAAA